MGWIGKIFLVIIVLGALAILADIITWIYEVAWIIPIILVIVVGFFVWRKSMLRKKMKTWNGFRRGRDSLRSDNTSNKEQT